MGRIVKLILSESIRSNEYSVWRIIRSLYMLEPTDEVILYLDSGGGELETAFAMAVQLERHPKTKIIVTGMCGSSAVLLFAACKERIMMPYSTLYFHEGTAFQEEEITWKKKLRNILTWPYHKFKELIKGKPAEEKPKSEASKLMMTNKEYHTWIHNSYDNYIAKHLNVDESVIRELCEIDGHIMAVDAHKLGWCHLG